MIRISTQTKCSSPTIIWTRSYCTVESSLVELSADIDLMYEYLTEKHQFSMSLDQLDVIQQKIHSGLYVLSPLHVKFIKKEYLNKLRHDGLTYCPDIMFGTCPDPDIICLVMPNKEDELVLKALSLTLYRLSRGHMQKYGNQIDNPVESFYYSLKQMGKVDRLHKLDLAPSVKTIPFSL